MPGSTPATSQLDWLISTTAITVLSWSRATRDLLKSFGWGIRALHQLVAATMVPSPRRLPHTISPRRLPDAGAVLGHESARVLLPSTTGQGPLLSAVLGADLPASGRPVPPHWRPQYG